MSNIIEFLKGTGTDNKGRTLGEILEWSDDRLENSHNTIQWLFPLDEPSQYNTDAPVLTENDLAELKTKEVQAGILKAYDRFTKFYNDPQWLTPHNHNYLRITRILKCLGLAGLENEKKIMKQVLNVVYTMFKDVIGTKTKKFWDEA